MSDSVDTLREDTSNMAAENRNKGGGMIVLGVILLLVGYLLLPRLTGIPLNVETICVWGGWILLIVGIVLLVLGRTGRSVGGRSNWY
jgi:protein-S-isoprenylcysteine O-methyltransferase Ste14